jgi:glucose-6-phosphate isomerase
LQQEIQLDISRIRSRAIGAEHGISPSEYKQIEKNISRAHKVIAKEKKSGDYGFYTIHKDRAMWDDVEKTAKTLLKNEYENLVILGIGGSALGITTLLTALKPQYYNLQSREERKGFPRVFVMDNVDPDTFSEMMELCDPKKTLYNVISKSGTTAETVAQLFVVLEQIQKSVGKSNISKHVVFTTGPVTDRKSLTPMQDVCSKHSCKSFEIPLNIGGRFSVFSPVGLFPAALLGLDLKAMAAGCRAMERRCNSTDLKNNPAYLNAGVHHYLMIERGRSISVMMPYSNKLRDLADWYRQLWAESLGKQENRDGTNSNLYAGQTPVNALGVTDQHSQLQLYLEGPHDKVVTILEETGFNSQLPIKGIPASLKSLKYMRNRSMGQLMHAERKATIDALQASGRPVVKIKVPVVNESTLAQLFYLFEVQTAITGALLDINPFDQPAVEQIKIFTREYLGNK